MRASEMLEISGLPTYYVTHVVTENAGDGNVRVWNCTERHGVLVPSCEIIIPAHRVVLCAEHITECAREVFDIERLKNGTAFAH